MKFQIGQLVKPVRRRHRFRGGTLAMVKSEPEQAWLGTDADALGAWLLWLNGDYAGEEVHEPLDLFKVVSK